MSYEMLYNKKVYKVKVLENETKILYVGTTLGGK